MNQDNLTPSMPTNNTSNTPPPVNPPAPASPTSTPEPKEPATPPKGEPIGASNPPTDIGGVSNPPTDMGGLSNPPTDMGVGNPKIGVELEESKPNQSPTSAPTPDKPQEEEAKIEVAATDIPIKSYDRNRTSEQPTAGPVPVSPALGGPSIAPMTSPPPPAGNPPVKVTSGSPTAIVTALAILALVIGSFGGFFGFRYWDNLKTSASEANASPSPTITAPESPSLDVNAWSSYTSNLYNFSLKYPNGWFASTTDPEAQTLVFASDQETLDGDLTGFKIEINFQDANGKTLKSWVEANSVTINERSKAQEITVDGQTAYQQTVSKPQPSVVTYIARGEKIMTITYTAPPEMLGEGGDWYNNLINSITLT